MAGDARAFLWLQRVARAGEDFSGELFEVPDTLPAVLVGERRVIEIADVVDWMIRESGRLIGGYSLRFHRERLPEEERDEFDRFIGVTEYG